MYLEHFNQYHKPCVNIQEGDNDPQAIINFAFANGAVFKEEPDSLCLVVSFPDRPPELYTETALRRSFPLKKKAIT